ncbi:hypothetical protein RHGRI_009648 [Rhododendron griersonianum]|uniref:Uncharacterized protein n=1 Tax=Rhododendron griersonianum TaxID=479676 RepID=A0AAV6KFJ1_9ERIC|nr:hypothetical protein RHGRI_009648 [Rhododendron griersonianum]
MPENCLMEVEEAFQEEEAIQGAEKNEKKSRKKARDSQDSIRQQSRLVKGILVSLTKPSHTLKTGSENVRTKNRARLRRLLSRLVRRHNWDEASGVLSVLLRGTGNERSPSRNRTKYWVAMELLKHINSGSVNSTKIQNVYEIWMKRIGAMKDWPIKDRFMVQLESILFFLRQGNVGEAHQAALSLMQEREFGSDPISNMVVGLTFCQLWYTTISKELQFRNSDESYTPIPSDMETRDEAPIANSEGHATVDTHQVGSSFQADSDTSVRNDKEVARDVDLDQHREVSMEVDDNLQKETTYKNNQSLGFYMDAAEDSGHEKSPLSNFGGNMQFASTFNAHGLDSWLLPFQLSHPNKNFEDVICSQRDTLNDHYKGAVKHLRLALCSTPPVYEALLPLVQMLLFAGHIDEAVNELEKFGHSSQAALPLSSCENNISAHYVGDLELGFSNCGVDAQDDICDWVAVAQDVVVMMVRQRIKFVLPGTVGNQTDALLLLSYRLALERYFRAKTSLLEHFDGANNAKLSTSFEDILKKDPTCSHSLAKLISMHQNGDYSPQQLVEMTALHLDATYAECNTWKEFASCFLKLHSCEEDQMSTCLNGNEGVNKQSHSRRFHRMSKTFTDGTSGKTWRFRDSELLTYKAASASHMYGPEFEYVVKVYKCLEDRDNDLFLYLQMHMQNSVGFYPDSNKTNQR